MDLKQKERVVKLVTELFELFEVFAEARGQPQKADDSWLSLAHVKAEHGIAPRVVTEAAQRNELVVNRVGGVKRGRLRVRRSELERWISSRTVAPKAKTPAAASPEAEYLHLVGATRRG